MSKYRITMDGRVYEIEVERMDGDTSVRNAKSVSASGTLSAQQREKDVPKTAAQTAGGNTVVSPMPGTVLKVYAAAGDEVKKGQPILVLEAMKMENEITASRDGKVTALHVVPGDTVQGGTVLFEIGE